MNLSDIIRLLKSTYYGIYIPEWFFVYPLLV